MPIPLADPGIVAGCQGEQEADLALLKGFYTRPECKQQSNYFIDLWEGQNLDSITRISGLTNNHALFINAHGKKLESGRYVLYLQQSLLAADDAVPYYTINDLARMMGRGAVSNIHNVVLSACNAEGALDVKEIRSAFPNATNIIHCAAGELGYQAMFVQALVNHSSSVKPVYEWSERNDRGELEYLTGPEPLRNAKRFAPYVAELFKPGTMTPYSIQRAGRELLEPDRFSKMARSR